MESFVDKSKQRFVKGQSLQWWESRLKLDTLRQRQRRLASARAHKERQHSARELVDELERRKRSCFKERQRRGEAEERRGEAEAEEELQRFAIKPEPRHRARKEEKKVAFAELIFGAMEEVLARAVKQGTATTSDEIAYSFRDAETLQLMEPARLMAMQNHDAVTLAALQRGSFVVQGTKPSSLLVPLASVTVEKQKESVAKAKQRANDRKKNESLEQLLFQERSGLLCVPNNLSAVATEQKYGSGKAKILQEVLGDKAGTESCRAWTRDASGMTAMLAHASQNGARTLIVSEDANSRLKARQPVVGVLTLRSYIEGLCCGAIRDYNVGPHRCWPTVICLRFDSRLLAHWLRAMQEVSRGSRAASAAYTRLSVDKPLSKMSKHELQTQIIAELTSIKEFERYMLEQFAKLLPESEAVRECLRKGQVFLVAAEDEVVVVRSVEASSIRGGSIRVKGARTQVKIAALVEG